jgi:hypothetical protein
MPRSSTPATPVVLALTDNRILPSASMNGVGFRNDDNFGAQSSRPAFSLCTLRHPPVTRRHGNTRYRSARYGFDRTGLPPVGSQQRVSLTHAQFLSLRAFPSAIIAILQKAAAKERPRLLGQGDRRWTRLIAVSKLGRVRS